MSKRNAPAESSSESSKRARSGAPGSTRIPQPATHTSAAASSSRPRPTRVPQPATHTPAAASSSRARPSDPGPSRATHTPAAASSSRARSSDPGPSRATHTPAAESRSPPALDDDPDLFLGFEDDDSFADRDFQPSPERGSESPEEASEKDDPLPTEKGKKTTKGKEKEPAKTAKTSKGKEKEPAKGKEKEKGTAKGKEKEAGTVKEKETGTEQVDPTQAALAAITTAMRHINPSVGHQANMVASWTQIEAQHAMVALTVEQNQLLRAMGSAIAQLLTDDEERQRAAAPFANIPRARIPAHFLQGMEKTWGFIGSPFSAISTIASVLSWVRRRVPNNLIAGSRTNSDGQPVHVPVTAERLAQGFGTVGGDEGAGEDEEDGEESEVERTVGSSQSQH